MAAKKRMTYGNSVGVQWLGHRAFTAESVGSIPVWGTKTLQVVQPKKKKREREKDTQINGAKQSAQMYKWSTNLQPRRQEHTAKKGQSLQ